MSESKLLVFSSREKDLDEVLQTSSVFVNVSKGQVAKKDDLTKAFGTDDLTEICKQVRHVFFLPTSFSHRILSHFLTFYLLCPFFPLFRTDPGQRRAPGVRQGEAESDGVDVQGHCDCCGREVCQPADQEAVYSQPHWAGHEGHPLLCQDRQEHQTAGPDSRRRSLICLFSYVEVYLSCRPTKIWLGSVHESVQKLSVKSSLNALACRSQALEVIRQLKETMEIQRAHMRLRLVLPAKEAKRLKEKLKPLLEVVESEDFDEELEMVRSNLLYYYWMMWCKLI